MSSLSKLSILIIDKDHQIIAILKNVLNVFGFKKIHIASDGEEAIKLMASKPIDIVLTDWGMKPMNGIEFIEYVRRNPASPNPFVPIIMVTGRANKEDVEKARDTGITEFLIKPFTVNDLRTRITGVIKTPRKFILSKNYVGPDRRRKDSTPPDGVERRSED